jgi:Ca2+/Na+ antiporter
MQALERFCFLIIWPLEKLLPIKILPELCLALVFLLIYFMVEFILTVLNAFAAYTNMSHFLMGLTIMVWGADNIELINLSIYMSKGEDEIGLLASLGSCVVSLLLVLPLAALLRMLERKDYDLAVFLQPHTRN